MKKIYTLAAALMLTAIAANAQDNLIINGDFEDWTEENPTNFKEVGTADPIYNDLLTKETTTVKSGNSVKQESKAQGSTQYLEYSNLIPVTAGNSYTISYWYLDNDTKARTRLWSTWLDDANKAVTPTSVQSNIQLEAYSTDSPNWVNKTVTVTAPAGATKIRYQVRTYHQGGVGGGYIYYDDLSFIENGVAGVKEDAISGLKMYPNPVSGGILNIASDNNTDKAVAIYDVVGKEVLNTVSNDGIVNVSGLTAGIYMIRITEEGKTATKKLVIK